MADTLTSGNPEFADPLDVTTATAASPRGSLGRRVPLTDAQQGLAERYLPMARSLAKPLKRAWPLEGEEFESAAMLALVEAAQSFDPERNVKFATFARYRIWGALRDVQRALVTAGWRGDVENAPSVASLTHDAEERGRVLGTEPDPPVGQELESTEFVEHWLRKLPARHAAACREIYLRGKSQGEAALAIGCSKSRLSYLHKESIELINDAWDYQASLAVKNKNLNKPRKARLLS
ncbi:MAG: sigma-70 family RNA polymerase sigma factor [Isosphaeraceae bacterium]